MVKYELAKIKNRNTFMRPKDPSDIPFSQKLDMMISKIKDRVEREVPDRGYFRNFAEDMALNHNYYGKAAAICIERDENVEGNALLLVSVLHPHVNADASVMLTSGNRDTILKYMNNKDFKNEVANTINELSESLKG